MRLTDLLQSRAVHIFLLVARREFVTRVRSRFFIVGTVVLMVLLGGYIVVQTVLINRSTTTVKIGFNGGAEALAQPLTAVLDSQKFKVQTQTVEDVAVGKDAVRSGKLDALVAGDSGAPDVFVKDQLDPAVAANLNTLVKAVVLNRALTAGDLDPTTIDTQVVKAGINLQLLDPNAALRTQRTVVGVFVAALLYTALVVYGQFVVQGVVEEKANRIIEILMSTVRPRQMLFGKVVGIGLVGLVQLFLLGVVAMVVGTRTQAINIPSVGVEAVLGGLLWFVLGFLFYALIYAAAGSMISRQEDAAAVTTPITLLIVGTYLAFFWVVANPDNPIATLLSIIPPFSPVLMASRIATGDAAAWQVALAVVLAIAGIIGLNALAARIYSNSVLQIGSRVKLSQAWRGAD